MGDSVRTIGSSAFIWCDGLTSVTIPKSVTSIGERAFYGAVKISKLYCNATLPPSAYPNSFESLYYNTELYVPKGTKNAYASSDGWKNFLNILEMDENTTISQINYECISFCVTDDIIHIENAPLGSSIFVYDIKGESLMNQRVLDEDVAIKLPRNETYIIKIGEKTFKVKIW